MLADPVEIFILVEGGRIMTRIKKLKRSTVGRYSARQLWRAVERRSDAYRVEFGKVFKKEDGAFFFLTTTRDDREALKALVELDGVER